MVPEAQEVQTVWTSEFGVARPEGLAYEPSRGELLVAGGGPNGTRILRLGPDEDARGSVLLPPLANPATLAFDEAGGQLTAIADGARLEVPGRTLTGGRASTDRVAIDGLALDGPASAAFDAQTDTWFVLEEGSDTVALITGGEFSTPPERLSFPPSTTDRLIAFHPTRDLLYVLDPDERRLDGVDRQGNVETSYSLESTALSDPVAMVFAPSTDSTDDPDNQNLYVADSGDDSALGGVTELSLAAETTAATAATVDTATLVQTIDTSAWDPASPDPSGIVWMPAVDELAVADSEVDETTGAGWNDVNLWRSTRTGSVVGVGTMWGPNSAGSFSREPTGLGYDDASGTLFVSDDSADAVFTIRRGSDGLLGTRDDIVGAIDTDQYGLNDTEDPEFHPASGDLFFLDGNGMEIYRVDPVDGVFGNSDDTMTHFDISHLGPRDFEGLSSNPGRDTLFVGARTTEEIYEITFDGTLVRRIDVPVSELRFISGLAVAPASDGSGQMHLWIVDRAVDNGADPDENDGKIFEISAPDIGSAPDPGNSAPVVDAVTIDQTTPRTDDTLTVTVDATDADGDALTFAYQWTANGSDIPGATNPTLDLSVDGNGDKGDDIAVRVTASDGTATSDPVTSSPVTVVNTPPAFDQDLGDQTNTEGDTVSLSAAASDADADALTYTATGLPDGLTIDAATGVISGTIATGAAAQSPYAVTVTVDDGATTTDDTLTWTITAPDPAPAAPAQLSATVTSVGVILDWDDNTEPDLAGYHVYRSADEPGPYERLNTSPLSGSAYTDGAAPQGASHYRVTAVDTGGRESEPAAVSAARLILFRSASSNATRNATSLSVPRPSGVAAGDVMVAAIGVRSAPTITAPPGWALVRVDTNGSTMRQAVYARTATASEPSTYSWSFSAGTASAGGLVLAYRGVDTSASVDASSGQPNASSGAITAPTLTTTVPDTLLIGFFGIANNPSITEPPGMIEQVEVVQNAGKDKLAMEAADEVLSATGSSGSRAATANQSGANIGQLVALRPHSQ
jgi:hypothetical protein